MTEYAALIRFGAIGLLLVFVYGIAHHYGYARGAEDKGAYYEPILRQAADDKITADQRADAADLRAVQITSQVEQAHADLEKNLSDRATAAEQRIAGLLRDHATASPDRRGEVSGVSSGPSQRSGTPASDERDNRLAASVSTVGRQCEHDASELAEWQQWYDRQRSSLIQVTKE